MSRDLYDELESLTTEARNPRTKGIDLAPTEEILRMLNDEDRLVADVVRGCLPEVARASTLAEETLRGGGRIVYMGAGTSGRLGVLDAAECPPTFGVESGRIVGLIAGGRETLVRSREGVEDDEEGAVRELAEAGVGPRDLVVGITASRRTPYVTAGLAEARRRGARTVFVTCNARASVDADVVITAVVGPEALAGSTRLKAGTAQKMILNMISTSAMIRLGKAYQNLMIDLRPASRKLVERAKRIVRLLAGVSYEDADAVFEASGRNVKVAVVMARLGVDRGEAERRLRRGDGFLRAVLEESSSGGND
jgi:N-acetylmuramic acid 6-phosphate etherase